VTEELHDTREAHAKAEEFGGVGMPEAVRVELIRDAAGADESVESLAETVGGDASAVRPTDEEFDRFSDLGVDGGRLMAPFVANELDELGRLFVNRDDPLVVKLPEWDADCIVSSGFSDQALTIQARHLPGSQAGPSSQKEGFGLDILLCLKSLLEECVDFGGDRLGELTIERGEIAGS
jgi:hypothetical protein